MPDPPRKFRAQPTAHLPGQLLLLLPLEGKVLNAKEEKADTEGLWDPTVPSTPIPPPSKST